MTLAGDLSWLPDLWAPPPSLRLARLRTLAPGSAVVSYGARGAGRVWQHPGRGPRPGSPTSSAGPEP